MEIGAVKQAFNNELILLKKKLNQAKTQIIHKLTRKAKQLTEKKKAPEAVQEKCKKKAENAVKEVLILKKIKPRDIGRFIVVHKGNLQDYLNKPQVDNDKACARILLHKAMQEKYKFIRNKFSNIPIKDLFMSRNERLKLKKEEKMRKKEKRDRKKAKNDKNKVVNAEGDWDVEDFSMKKNKVRNPNVDKDSDDEDMSENEDNDANSDKSESDVQNMSDDQELQSEADSDDENSAEDESGRGFKISFKGQSDNKSEDGDVNDASDDQESSEEEVEIPTPKSKRKPEILTLKELSVKNKPNKKHNPVKSIIKSNLNDATEMNDVEFKLKIGEKKSIVKQDKKQKESNKNKNLQDKIRQNKFKKDSDDTNEVEKKVVDPFFVTASGENYMSVFEPRQPDEIKEVHRQGNRAYRRAVMFGNVPKHRPRPQFREDNFDRQNAYGNRPAKKFNEQNGFSRNSDKFDNKNDHNKFNNRFDDRNKPRFNNTNDRKPQDEKPEKLHPSWEAKKKQSGILPFQGKKIVFDES
ncbi:hypothetical protein O0L34_g15513 [Tuta absoluta]|nr:hypothetical protein O0L34_g15513 [Tuta absoluta]